VSTVWKNGGARNFSGDVTSGAMRGDAANPFFSISQLQADTQSEYSVSLSEDESLSGSLLHRPHSSFKSHRLDAAIGKIRLWNI